CCTHVQVMIRSAALLALCLVLRSPVDKVPFCECASDGPFLNVAPRAPLVALVRVNKFLSYTTIYNEQVPLCMEAEIIDLYKGQEKRKLVRAWGDNGILCRPYLSVFKEGGYYVIAFDSTGRRSGMEKPQDYWISVCGTYWLNVDTTNKSAT